MLDGSGMGVTTFLKPLQTTYSIHLCIQHMNDHKLMTKSTQLVVMQEAAYQCVEEMKRRIVRKTYEYFSFLYAAILMMIVSISVSV